MRRNHQMQSDVVESDSFLDIVANMVGILIILVMVVGVRVKYAPTTNHPPSPNDRLADEVIESASVVRSMEGDLMSLVNQINTVRIEAARRQQERDLLAYMVSTQRHEIDSRRQELDAARSEEFDAKRQLAEAENYRNQLAAAIDQIDQAEPETVKIETYPTPLSRTVDDGEIHFQLRNGRIAFVPVDDLLEEMKTEARANIRSLRRLPSVTSTVGPLGGFRMRFTIARVSVPIDPRNSAGGVASYARLEEWELIPSSSALGETIQQALTPGSEFLGRIGKLDPDRATVTLWIYPNSFTSFRRVRKELYARGLATAARPLPKDMPIAGSREGSKSAAQ